MLLRTARTTLRRAAVAGAQQRRGASALAATRPWHEPDILSTETKQFRDAELARLGAEVAAQPLPPAPGLSDAEPIVLVRARFAPSSRL